MADAPRRKSSLTNLMRILRTAVQSQLEPYLAQESAFYELLITRRGAMALKVDQQGKINGEAGIRPIKGGQIVGRLAWDELTGHERFEFIQDATGLQSLIS